MDDCVAQGSSTVEMGGRICRHIRSSSRSVSDPAPFVEPESSDSDPEPETNPEPAVHTVEVAPLAPIRTDFGTFEVRRIPPPDRDWNSPDHRLHVVWIVSRAEDRRAWAGLHWSEGLSAYSALVGLNGNSIGGLRWRRVYSVNQGHNLFREESAGHQVAREPVPYFRWRLVSGR
jgi:hypothetical protein